MTVKPVFWKSNLYLLCVKLRFKFEICLNPTILCTVRIFPWPTCTPFQHRAFVPENYRTWKEDYLEITQTTAPPPSQASTLILLQLLKFYVSLSQTKLLWDHFLRSWEFAFLSSRLSAELRNFCSLLTCDLVDGGTVARLEVFSSEQSGGTRRISLTCRRSVQT